MGRSAGWTMKEKNILFLLISVHFFTLLLFSFVWFRNPSSAAIAQYEQQIDALTAEMREHNLTETLQASTYEPAIPSLPPNTDLGYALVNGATYLAPFDDLSGEKACNRTEKDAFIGALAHIEYVAALYTQSGYGGCWAQISIESKYRNYPALWIKYDDLLPYTESNKQFYTGPFSYSEALYDPVADRSLPAPQFADAEIYISFADDDKNCDRDKGVACVSVIDADSVDSGLLDTYVDTQGLAYPSPADYPCVIVKTSN